MEVKSATLVNLRTCPTCERRLNEVCFISWDRKPLSDCYQCRKDKSVILRCLHHLEANHPHKLEIEMYIEAQFTDPNLDWDSVYAIAGPKYNIRREFFDILVEGVIREMSQIKEATSVKFSPQLVNAMMKFKTDIRAHPDRMDPWVGRESALKIDFTQY